MPGKHPNSCNSTQPTHQLLSFNLIGSLDDEGLDETHEWGDVARALPQDRGQEVGEQRHVCVWNPSAVHLHQQ